MDRYPPAHSLAAEAQRHHALFFVERKELALAAGGQQAINAVGDLDVDDLLPRAEVDPLIRPERSD